MIIGIESSYNSEELINLGVNLTIKNYNNLNIEKLITFENMTLHKLKNEITNSIEFMFQENFEIVLHENNLKGGFIASVISFECKTQNKNHQFLNYITATHY